jgi:hypothetical protein
MSSLNTVIASLAGSRLTLGELLHRLHVTGRLAPLVQEALAQQWLRDQALTAGLSVSIEELQHAADVYRRRRGLLTAADTRDWLAAQCLSVEDFEAGLQETLLADKLRKELTATEVDTYFAEHRAGYEQLRVTLLFVGREELARELASQVRDEGRELESAALEHGLVVMPRLTFRKELDPTLAQALDAAGSGELVGPVGTPEGFALLQARERRTPALDGLTRTHIEQELFANWVDAHMKQATIDLGLLAKS